MNITHNGFTYDSDFIIKLNDSLSSINAFNYNKFINDKTNTPYSILETLGALERNVPTNYNIPRNTGKHITSLSKQKELVIKFFASFGLDKQVEEILNGKNSDYKVTIDRSIKGSSVGHSGYNEFINFEVQFDESAEGCATISHEMAHALSRHHTRTLELAKNANSAKKLHGENSKEFIEARDKYRKFTDSKSKFTVDCTGEIESHIIEKMFMLFLTKQGILTKDDFNIFITNLNNSLKNNIVLMLQENDILSNLSNPVTEQSFENFYNKYKHDRNLDPLMQRVKIMSERNSNSDLRNTYSEYRFRYIVGEIVSTMWLKKYLESDKTQKEEMRLNFVKFLNTTDECTLENCCEITLGKGETLQTVTNAYLNFISTQQLTI